MWRSYQISFCQRQKRLVGRLVLFIVSCLTPILLRSSEKSAYNDLVTEADQEVERLLISGLRERFPSTLFIGEESVAAGAKCRLTDDKTWIIDPIDGTTNFINSNPHICTILAFMVDKAGTRLNRAHIEYNC